MNNSSSFQQWMSATIIYAWKLVAACVWAGTALVWATAIFSDKPPAAVSTASATPVAIPPAQTSEAPAPIAYSEPRAVAQQSPMPVIESASKQPESPPPAAPAATPTPVVSTPPAQPVALPSPTHVIQRTENPAPSVPASPPPSPPPPVQTVTETAPTAKAMPPASAPVATAKPPEAPVVVVPSPEPPAVPQKPKDEWAGYTAQMRTVISEGVLRKDEADVLAALSLECTSVTQSKRGKPGDELISVVARFRFASNPKQTGKKPWSQSYSSAASFNPKLFQGITSLDTIERVIQDLKENLLEDKETLAKLQQSVTP